MFALVTALGACSAPSAEPSLIARQALERAPAIDGHNDLLLRFRAGDHFDATRFDLADSEQSSTSLARWKAGGFGASFVTVGSLRESNHVEGVIDAIRFVRTLAALHSDAVGIATDPDGARELVRDGKLAWILHLEGAEQLEGSSEALRTLHGLGLRSVGLVHMHGNELADSSTDVARHGGLSSKGAALVRELNELGMLVDLAHAADDTVRDVLELSTAPPLVTHAALRSLAPISRNLPDELVDAIGARRGVVMIDFVPYHVSAEFAAWYEEGDRVWNELLAEHGGERTTARAGIEAWERAHPAPATSPNDVVRHVERVRLLAGSRAVGIGSDFEGIDFTIPELDDVSDLPALFTELARRGWSTDELRALSSENLLRVWDETWAIRRQDPEPAARAPDARTW